MVCKIMDSFVFTYPGPCMLYVAMSDYTIFFCKSKTLNSQYLGPKTVMNMRTDRGKDSGTVLRYYIDPSLSTGTNSSFH